MSRLVSLTLSRCLQCDEVQYHIVWPRPVRQRAVSQVPRVAGIYRFDCNWESFVNYLKTKSTCFLWLFYSLTNSLQLTLSGSKADIVFLVDVSQNKRADVVNKMIWIDDYITVKTADYTNRSFVAVCCSTENQVIAPCAILFHASQVISPRWVSMDKVEQICSIGLWERKKKFKVNWIGLK